MTLAGLVHAPGDNVGFPPLPVLRGRAGVGVFVPIALESKPPPRPSPGVPGEGGSGQTLSAGAWITIVCTILAALFLTGCKDEGGSGGGAASSSAPSKKPTIGVSFETLQTEYWVGRMDPLKAELAKRNLDVLEAIADGDANRQLEQVQNFIARKVDGIIIAPKDAQTVMTMIKAANRANIPIVLYNRPPADPKAKAVTVVADNFAITEATVRYMCEEAKKSGKEYKAMVLIGDLGDQNAVGRRDGFLAAVK